MFWYVVALNNLSSLPSSDGGANWNWRSLERIVLLSTLFPAVSNKMQGAGSDVRHSILCLLILGTLL